MGQPFRIALLGAESTGKTQLAAAMAAQLQAQGFNAIALPEVLREWCAREGRTPRPAEQLGIAQAQAALVAGAPPCDVLIADTTPVMIAVYSDILFGDMSIYPFALEHQRVFDATLLTGLDIPWVADGLQRDGPHVREPVDAKVRAALQRGGISYKTVYGSGEERLANALRCVGAPYAPASGAAASQPQWQWQCDKCSDPECEHRLFTGLIRSKAAARSAR